MKLTADEICGVLRHGVLVRIDDAGNYEFESKDWDGTLKDQFTIPSSVPVKENAVLKIGASVFVGYFDDQPTQIDPSD